MTRSLLWLKIKLFFGWRPKITKKEIVWKTKFTKQALEAEEGVTITKELLQKTLERMREASRNGKN